METDEVMLSNGTLVRHRVSGYLGRIDGVTAIQSCFTSRGAPMRIPTGKERFQYRVVVRGEKIRRIAPAGDLEVLGAGNSIDVTCFGCQSTFSANPSVIDNPGGLCDCGGWICPECLACQPSPQTFVEEGAAICPHQRKRLLKRSTHHKRQRTQAVAKKVAPLAAPRFRN